MRPSARKRVRSAIAVAFGSWETMTKVWPRASTDSRRRSRISWDVVESRLPVGSSAKTTVGLEMRARAIATRCCWPPESSEGRCVRRSASPTRSITESFQSLSILPPPSSSGRRMFSSAVSIGRRLKNWKTKPMCLRRSFVSSVSLEVVDVRAVDRHLALGGLVQPGEDVHEGGLPGARRAHDSGELAARDVEVDAAEGVTAVSPSP